MGMVIYQRSDGNGSGVGETTGYIGLSNATLAGSHEEPQPATTVGTSTGRLPRHAGSGLGNNFTNNSNTSLTINNVRFNGEGKKRNGRIAEGGVESLTYTGNAFPQKYLLPAGHGGQGPTYVKAFQRYVSGSGTATKLTPSAATKVQIWIVGGGGAGGAASTDGGREGVASGGGAGGVIGIELDYSAYASSSYIVGAGGATPSTVSGGGTARTGNNGATTQISGSWGAIYASGGYRGYGSRQGNADVDSYSTTTPITQNVTTTNHGTWGMCGPGLGGYGYTGGTMHSSVRYLWATEQLLSPPSNVSNVPFGSYTGSSQAIQVGGDSKHANGGATPNWGYGFFSFDTVNQYMPGGAPTHESSSGYNQGEYTNIATLPPIFGIAQENHSMTVDESYGGAAREHSSGTSNAGLPGSLGGGGGGMAQESGSARSAGAGGNGGVFIFYY